MKILIIEDEPKTGDYLKQGLSEAGFVADLARNGTDGAHVALTEDYDLVVLDVMLPGMDGWEVLKTIRAGGKQLPVLFLTARDRVDERVKGLELGADDYLVKPFAFSELLARVRTLLRRGRSIEPDRTHSGGSGARPAAPPGDARAQGDPPYRQGIRVAGDVASSPGRSVAALAHCIPGLGCEFRQRYQCHRRCRAAIAREGRRRVRAQAHPNGSRHGLRARGFRA